MSAETLAAWLRCPTCSEPLTAVDTTILGCANGHRFDINKRGYVSLLAPRSRVAGDTPSMLDARARVLERGTYAPIVDALEALVPVSRNVHRILDAGAGTGYYLRSMLAPRPDARGLALDLAPAAVARAVRSASVDVVDGLVADTWRPLPIRDGVTDVILNIFAPRNLTEFHRILAPGGTLLVVVPRAEHLHELREEGRMLDVPADKASSLIDSAHDQFALAASTSVVFGITYDAALAESLIAMGPSAHHTAVRVPTTADPAETVPAETATAPVTAAVEVLAFTAR